MTHIKCPNCKAQFKIDLPPLPDSLKLKMNIGITPCHKCGAPLINFNDSDHWEVLKPHHMEKVPPSVRDQVMKMMVDGLIEGLQSMLEQEPDPETSAIKETPFTRNHFFMSGEAEPASKGCVVLMGEGEWPSFIVVTKADQKIDMIEALHRMATHDYKQNIELN